MTVKKNRSNAPGDQGMRILCELYLAVAGAPRSHSECSIHFNVERQSLCRQFIVINLLNFTLNQHSLLLKWTEIIVSCYPHLTRNVLCFIECCVYSIRMPKTVPHFSIRCVIGIIIIYIQKIMKKANQNMKMLFKSRSILRIASGRPPCMEIIMSLSLIILPFPLRRSFTKSHTLSLLNI